MIRSLFRWSILCLLLISTPVWAQSPWTCPDELFASYDKTTRLWGYRDLTKEWKIPPAFVKVMPFEGKNAIVMQGSQWGVIDCSGFQVVKARFQAIENFNYGRGWVKQGELWGLINTEDKFVENPQFTAIRTVHAGVPLTWVEKDGLWGLYDKDLGRYTSLKRFAGIKVLSDSVALVRDAKTDYLAFFNQFLSLEKVDSITLSYPLSLTLHAYQRKGRWGAATWGGHPVVPPIYDTLELMPGGFFLLARQKGQWGIVRRDGREYLPCRYEAIGDFAEKHVPVRQNGAWAYFNNQGDNVSGFVFASASRLYRGLGIVQTATGWGLYSPAQKKMLVEKASAIPHREGLPFFPVKEGKTYRLLNEKGGEYSPLKPDTLCLNDSLDLMRLRVEGQWGYWQARKGLWAFAARFDQAEAFRQDLALVAQGKLWGVVKRSGDWQLSPRYDSLAWMPTLGQPFLRIWQSGRQGLADLGGRTLIPAQYDEIHLAGRGFKARQGAQYRILSAQGQALGEPWDFLSQDRDPKGSPLPDFPALAQKQGRWGLVDAKATLLLTPDYDSLYFIGSQTFIGWKQGKGVLISASGQVQGTATFDQVMPMRQGLAAARQGKLWGFVNPQGKWTIPAQYEEATDFEGRSALVKSKGLWGAIDRNGTWLAQPIHKSWTRIQGQRRLVK